MSEKKTAIEWLVEKLKEQEYLGVFCTPDAWGREEEIMKGIVEQGKEMEKQQIKDAYNHGYRSGEIDSQGFSEMELLHHDVSEFENANNYYKETFNK
jgi:hypothetical protein